VLILSFPTLQHLLTSAEGFKGYESQNLERGRDMIGYRATLERLALRFFCLVIIMLALSGCGGCVESRRLLGLGAPAYRADLEAAPIAEDFDTPLAAKGHIRAGHRVEPHLLVVKGGKQAESLSSTPFYA